jgi:hypothetical protein
LRGLKAASIFSLWVIVIKNMINSKYFLEMIKTYNKNSTRSFQTINIPKGTVLFRGLNYDKGSDFTSIFNDFIGYPGSQYYGIDPNMNVFFYPVPYVVDSVKIYDIHMMYITQYDIELFLMIKPSDISRANKDNDLYKDIFTTCSNLGETNKCGQAMSKDDPCFTEGFLTMYPQIDGYICIAEQDAAIFRIKYKDMLSNEKNIDKIKQILPGIVTNSRDITSIPEIVIHPLRLRKDDCHLVPGRFYNPETIVKYCINNRVNYNFFPFLYFTNNGIYNFKDFMLKDDKLILDMIGKATNNKLTKTQLYTKVDEVFTKMLDEGYKINNVNYKAFVDNRTGFYRVFIEGKNINNKNNKRNTQKRVFRKFGDDTFEGYLDSYVVKPNIDPVINTLVSTHKDYIKDFINILDVNDYALKKKLALKKGDIPKFVNVYYIDKVFDRPELQKYTNYRKKRKNVTNKRINNHFTAMLKLNGFDPNNLSDVSSVRSVDEENE